MSKVWGSMLHGIKSVTHSPLCISKLAFVNMVAIETCCHDNLFRPYHFILMICILCCAHFQSGTVNVGVACDG